MGVGSQPHDPAASTSGKGPVPTVQEAGWASGPVLTGGISRPHRDSIPDRKCTDIKTVIARFTTTYQKSKDIALEVKVIPEFV